MQEKYIKINNLQVSEKLSNFVNDELLKNTNVSSENFWLGLEKTLDGLAPKNKELIKFREELQKKIDEWHLLNKDASFDEKKYFSFLKSIGYIVEQKEDFKINTSNVDEEIATIAGPQLVVPVDNARYALNAANARWGSLYDALYGTDVIPGDKGENFNEDRAKKVISYVRNFLDEAAPISDASWKEITEIKIKDKDYLSDVININPDDGLSWSTGNKNRKVDNINFWIGKRAQAGRLIPKGFPKLN